MMNYIWAVLIGISIIAGIITGTITDVQDNLFAFADSAVEIAIGPKEHPANSAIAMYIAASLMGLGNACTPLGIKAMQELQTLNKTENIATDAQCMVMAISTGSICLLPTSVIAMRTAVQAEGAAEIVGPTILTTFAAAIVCVIMTKLLGRLKCFRYDYIIEKERKM